MLHHAVAIIEKVAAQVSPAQHVVISVRKLVLNYFELRVGLELRLVFKLEKEAATFVFAGTHDEVKRFIKGV